MIIDLNEKEIKFIESMCMNIEMLVSMNLFEGNPPLPLVLEEDLNAIRALKLKFKIATKENEK